MGKDQDEGAREPARNEQDWSNRARTDDRRPQESDPDMQAEGCGDQPETGNTSQDPAKPPETSPGRARTVEEASYEGLRGPGRTMSTAIQQQGDQQRAGCRPSYGPEGWA